MSMELDARIAIVLGWVLMEDSDIGAWWKVPKGDPYCDAFESADAPPDYSTDLRCAMAAYEEFRKKQGWWLDILKHDKDGQFRAVLRRKMTWKEASAENPAEALCLAILTALATSSERRQ